MGPNDTQALENEVFAVVGVPEEVAESLQRPDKIVSSSTSKLDYLPVVCIVVNRMVGMLFHPYR